MTTTHIPDRSRIPASLQSLDWRPMDTAKYWDDGTVPLVAVPGDRRTESPPTYGRCPNGCGRRTEDPEGGQCDECWREDDLDFGDDEEREIARGE